MRTLVTRHTPTVALVALLAVAAGGLLAAQEIGSQALLDGLKNPERWLTYSGDYTGQRHSPLTQVTPANVAGLAPQWTFQTGIIAARNQATPLVIDGILYFTGWLNNAWAIDGRTGRQLWRYQRTLPPDIISCCGLQNRGFSVAGNRLFMATLDAHIIALDMGTGTVVWDTVIEDYRKGYANTASTLVVKDLVITGLAGADFGVPGYVDAFDIKTGKHVWRFKTVADPGEPGGDTWPSDPTTVRGGGSTWISGSYDPELNLIYWPTGNPAKDFNGKLRRGDNLYTNSVVALDAATGRLRWHYQFTPHDVWDYDATETLVLADLTLGGRPRKVVMQADRNGFFYVLDRATGEFLLGKPFVKTTWAERIDDKGRPVAVADQQPSEGGTLVCPGHDGGTNWRSPSFDPKLSLFFVNAKEQCETMYAWDQPFVPGQLYLGGSFTTGGDPIYSALRAIDPTTGARKWEFRLSVAGTQSAAGVLSTASGLVFTGDGVGNFIALASDTGRYLWHYPTGGAITAAPMSYQLDGRQYVAVAAGTNLVAFALPRGSSPAAPGR
jgi:alcohol dehydrogenase (cytochrome c)